MAILNRRTIMNVFSMMCCLVCISQSSVEANDSNTTSDYSYESILNDNNTMSDSSYESLLNDNNTTSDYSYESILALRESMFSPKHHSTSLRPVRNQWKPIIAMGHFYPVTIVSLDDVQQKLVINGYFYLYWIDEVLESRNFPMGSFNIRPSDVWIPYMHVINTLENLEGGNPLGVEKNSYMEMASNGIITWVPNGFFSTYCHMNLKDFPFDVQNCKIEICPLNYEEHGVVFQLEDYVSMEYFYPNPGWELLECKVKSIEKSFFPNVSRFSCAEIHFKLKRRYTLIVLNVILPAMLMSVLNNFVFLIPSESGENISYSITVLLAIAVFLSIVSSLTPQVTDIVPSLNIYLFFLLLTSVATVTGAILTERIHHHDDQEKEEDDTIQNTSRRSRNYGDDQTVSHPNSPTGCTPDPDVIVPERPRNKRSKNLAGRINLTFFVIVTFVNLATNIWYFVSTNAFL